MAFTASIFLHLLSLRGCAQPGRASARRGEASVVENTLNSSGGVGRLLSPSLDVSLAIDHDSQPLKLFGGIDNFFSAFHYSTSFKKRCFNHFICPFIMLLSTYSYILVHRLQTGSGRRRSPRCVCKQGTPTTKTVVHMYSSSTLFYT